MSKTLLITIEAGLRIGLAGCEQNETLEIEIAEEEYEAMSDEEREEWVQSHVEDWANNYIEFFGQITAEEAVKE